MNVAGQKLEIALALAVKFEINTVRLLTAEKFPTKEFSSNRFLDELFEDS